VKFRENPFRQPIRRAGGMSVGGLSVSHLSHTHKPLTKILKGNISPKISTKSSQKTLDADKFKRFPIFSKVQKFLDLLLGKSLLLTKLQSIPSKFISKEILIPYGKIE